jgi:uncharacterized protein (DUF2252 family)
MNGSGCATRTVKIQVTQGERDFDETVPGPFEWDVKRLAASFPVAGRDGGFSARARRKIVLAAAAGYGTGSPRSAPLPAR